MQLISDVGSSNLFIQYDIYHMQIMEGDIARTLQKHLGRIAHVQLADNPGRFEPGTGEINYSYLFKHLDSIGYRGWVGCEYKPRTTTLESLGWHAAQTHSRLNPADRSDDNERHRIYRARHHGTPDGRPPPGCRLSPVPARRRTASRRS